MQVTEKQRSALAAVCDALIPSIQNQKEHQAFWQRAASDMQVADKILSLVDTLGEREQKDFAQLLWLLASPILGLTYWGALKSADQLSLAQREKLLRKWSVSPLPDLRKGFGSLKKLTALVFFGDSPAGANNPNWGPIGYEGLGEGIPCRKGGYQNEKINAQSDLSYDVVIVGSGAGGSVVAAELAKAGQKVLVLEKGKYMPQEQFNNQELSMFNQLYDGQGLLTSGDGGVTVLAGSCLGGGTTVNWAGSFRTPDYILEEWAREHQNPQFLTEAFQDGFNSSELKNNIHTNEVKHNPQNQALWNGAKALNYKIGRIPRNVANPEDIAESLAWKAQGFSCLGDRYGIKQSSLKTHLRTAVDYGAKIMTKAEVTKIIIRQGEAKGVRVNTMDETGKRLSLNINAKRVVVSAGAIHTPSILKKSGLQHKDIGEHLYLHPTIPVSAVYDQAMSPWFGPMMSAVCDEFTQIDGNFGFKLETPPAHLGLMGVALGWESGKRFKEEMLKVKNVGTFIVLTRDKFGGRVTIDKYNNPVVQYSLSAYDKQHMIQGIQEACKIHRAAGAKRLAIPHNEVTHHEVGKADFDAFLAQIPKKKWEKNYFNLYTAHQMGTCRMGGVAKDYPLKPNGETREVKNLYVADGSAFPAASGVNPMVTIQALSYYVAQQIKATIRTVV